MLRPITDLQPLSLNALRENMLYLEANGHQGHVLHASIVRELIERAYTHDVHEPLAVFALKSIQMLVAAHQNLGSDSLPLPFDMAHQLVNLAEGSTTDLLYIRQDNPQLHSLDATIATV